MPLTKVQFKPGITSDVTSYTNEGGWFNGDKIRFRLGFPEKIGGWTKQSANTYQGSARDLLNWVALDGSNFLGLGTELKYYIEEGGAFSDITPLRATTGAGDVSFQLLTDHQQSLLQTRLTVLWKMILSRFLVRYLSVVL